MTIRKKLISSTAIYMVILLLLGVTIHCGYSYVTEKASLANDFDMESKYLQMMLRGLNEVIINDGTPSSLRTEKEGMNGFDEIHNRLMAHIENPGIRKILSEKVDPAWQEIKQDIKPFLEHYVDLSDDEMMIKGGKLIVKAERIIEHIEELANKTRGVVNANSKISATVIGAMELIFPLLFLLSIILSYSLYRTITKPITELTAIAEGFNRGDLSLTMDETRRDEYGSVAVFFNKSTRKLEQEIEERKRAEERISHIAYHDGLTGLPNRYLLKDRLTSCIAHANRLETKVAVLYFDIDDFKRINDTLGHEAGDLLLKHIAATIHSSVRTSDDRSRALGDTSAQSTVSRLGGDEFTILLTDITDSQDTVVVVHRLMNMLNSPIQVMGNEVYMTISVGISVYPEDGEDAEELLKNADAAMYHAKKQGKNNFQFYQDSMNIVYLERLALESALRKAIENNSFILYYQPRIDTQTGNMSSMEALIRWPQPEKGFISPVDFIPIAEDTGLIIPLGEWILKTACAQNRAWQEMGFAPLCVSVNISGRQFQQKDFMTVVLDALESSGLDAQYLELEMTESVLMENARTFIEMLRQLKKIGVRLAMDDFGTGYSSFSYLKQFPLDVIKIDKSFIDDIPEDDDIKTIVAAMITMVDRLQLASVAEGVETKQQLDFLRDCQCDEVQGYYFSKPLSAEDFTALLEKSVRQPANPEKNIIVV